MTCSTINRIEIHFFLYMTLTVSPEAPVIPLDPSEPTLP